MPNKAEDLAQTGRGSEKHPKQSENTKRCTWGSEAQMAPDGMDLQGRRFSSTTQWFQGSMWVSSRAYNNINFIIVYHYAKQKECIQSNPHKNDKGKRIDR